MKGKTLGTNKKKTLEVWGKNSNRLLGTTAGGPTFCPVSFQLNGTGSSPKGC